MTCRGKEQEIPKSVERDKAASEKEKNIYSMHSAAVIKTAGNDYRVGHIPSL